MGESEKPNAEGYPKESLWEKLTGPKELWQHFTLSERIVHIFDMLMIPVVLGTVFILFSLAVVLSPVFVQSYEGRVLLLAFVCFSVVGWWALKRYVDKIRVRFSMGQKELDALEDMSICLESQEIRAWLTGDRPYLLTPGDTFASELIAQRFSALELIAFLDIPDAVPDRRNDVLIAVLMQVGSYLDLHEPRPDNLSPKEQESDFEELTLFVCRHWPDFLAAEEQLVSHRNFDDFIVPYIEGRLREQS